MLRVTPEAKKRLGLYASQRSFETGRAFSNNKAAEELFLRAPVKRRARRVA
jgi:hypothetical protein